MTKINPEPGRRPPNRSAQPARAWKKALRALSGPLLRLHHYREVRAKVLQDAMFLSDRQHRNADSGCRESGER